MSKKQPEYTEHISCKVRPETRQKLGDIVEKRGLTTVSQLVRTLIEEFVNRSNENVK